MALPPLNWLSSSLQKDAGSTLGWEDTRGTDVSTGSGGGSSFFAANGSSIYYNGGNIGIGELFLTAHRHYNPLNGRDQIHYGEEAFQNVKLHPRVGMIGNNETCFNTCLSFPVAGSVFESI